MFSQIVLFSLFSVTIGQAAVDIQGAGALPGGSGNAAAIGRGANPEGAVTVDLTDTSSITTAAVTVTGQPTTPVPAPIPVPVPVPVPAPIPAPASIPVPVLVPVQVKPAAKVYTPPKVVVPSKYYKQPVCEDIKDDKCYSIDEYSYCGFCAVGKYPLKGHACKYTEEKVLKKGEASKKVYDYEYETVIVPKCKCEGEFILKGEKCLGFTCDDMLALLLKCAGIKDGKKGTLEIPEKCLKKVGVKVEDLVNCKYIDAPTPAKKEKVVVHKPATKVVYDAPKVVVVKEDPKVVYVPVKASSSSSASASATATATGKDAAASASASASAGGR